jgi:hypothetical protein
MTDKTYKVTIDGLGLSLEREVSKEIGDQIVVLILTGNAAMATPVRLPVGDGRSGALPVQPGKKSGADQPQLSIREFLNEHDPKRSPDKITAIGVYLKDHSDLETFGRTELETAFQSAAEPIPANLPRDLAWAVRSGWIAARPGTKGQYYVTNSGRQAVTQKFPKELIRKTKQPVASAKKGKVDNT